MFFSPIYIYIYIIFFNFPHSKYHTLGMTIHKKREGTPPPLNHNSYSELTPPPRRRGGILIEGDTPQAQPVLIVV